MSAANRLDGGLGNDLLRGEDGDDMWGGNAVDTLDYGSRWFGEHLTIGLGNFADDGQAGERDNARADNEIVRGGRGDDRITGSSAGKVLYGGDGNECSAAAAAAATTSSTAASAPTSSSARMATTASTPATGAPAPTGPSATPTTRS